MTIFKHPFIQMLRLERRLGCKQDLFNVSLALMLMYQNNKFELEEAFKLGYYLPAQDFIKLNRWISKKLIKCLV